MSAGAEKKPAGMKEAVFDIVCLIASFGLVFLLPEKTDFLFYLIFGAAAFLFCIGFFRLGFLFEFPAGAKGLLFTALLFTVLGAAVNVLGIAGLYRGQGSGRSICAATLFVIEALLLYAIAGSRAETPGAQWKVSVLLRGAAVLLVLIGIAGAVKEQLGEASVIAGIMLVIEAICLWAMGSGNNPFYSPASGICPVPGMKTPTVQLSRDFADTETQLGRPWIGKIKSIRKDCIIYGPAQDGFYVYGYYHFGQFYVAGSASPLFPGPEDAKRHVTEEIPDDKGVLLSRELLPEAYADMFARYLKTGKARWSTELSHESESDRRK